MTIPALTSTPPLTRRARQRLASIEEIKTLARRQLTEAGPGALSLRAIARQMGTAPSALYRYFACSEELVTALCVDAYEAVADALTHALDGQPADDPARQWWAICRAYRRWWLDRPADFALIFGTSIPGYEQPPELTCPAASRYAALLGSVYAAAVRAGVANPDHTHVPRTIPAGRHCSQLPTRAPPDVPPQVAGILLNASASLRGYLMAEIFGRLEHLVGDTDRLFDAHLRTLMRGMGFQPDSIDAAACDLPRDQAVA